MFIKHKKLFLFSLLIITLISSMFFIKPTQEIKAKITDNELFRVFLPVYRSLRKIPDIVFTPYLFVNDDLKKISIVIDPVDILYLNENLPDSSPFTSVSLDENRVFAKAIFSSSLYKDEVDIRYKGLNANHWNSFKKSYRIKFSSDNLFEGASALNLVLPYDKNYYADLLNAYRAQKFGLITQDPYLSNVTINGQNHGVYLTSNHWSQDFLDGRKIPDETNIFGLNDGSQDLFGTNNEVNRRFISAFEPRFMNIWKSYVREDDSFNEIKSLLEIIEYSNDATFSKLAPLIIDMDKFYKWDVINILAGNLIFDYENLVLIFNTATGKFELSPNDTYMKVLEDDYIENSRLARRILSIDSFKEKRNDVLSEYINNEENLNDDIEYYNKIYKESRSEFFKDHAKKDNNFTYLNQVNNVRDIVIDNFYNAQIILDRDYGDVSLDIKPKKIEFTGSFDRFEEASYSLNQFLLNNPQFYSVDGNTVALSSGSHFFYKTIIIPKDLKLIINPGATLYMGKDVSLISYGEIIADGMDNFPINVYRANKDNTWGVFAIVNANKRSVIDNVNFAGGSEDKINGIIFTGMTSFHNTEIEISNSSFGKATGDDALNVKYGSAKIENSVFKNNSSDGIDIDFVESKSIISNNKLYENGGDAIDLSWSDILISDNNIDGCSDKGISVGEKSEPTLSRNLIKNCDIGIAVKDLSVASIDSNKIDNVRVGIAVYQKKQVFGGAKAYLAENVIENFQIEYEVDSLSEIDILN